MTKEQFKQTRINLGLTQPAMAQMIGKSKRAVQRYESGEKPVPDTIAILLDLITMDKPAHG